MASTGRSADSRAAALRQRLGGRPRRTTWRSRGSARASNPKETDEMRITALKSSLAAVIGEMDGLLEAAANDNNRELTAEEQATFDAKAEDAKKLQAQIAREESVLAFRAAAAAPVTLPGG